MSFSILVKGVVTRNSRQQIIELFQKSASTTPEIQPGGEILLDNELPESVYVLLKNKLSTLGHPVLEDSKASIVSKVKRLLEKLTSGESLDSKTRMSDFLATHTTYEYHYLSSVFSQLEGLTIERFFIQLKVERIKEQIEQGSLTLSEIAYKCGYSSPAHLTNQFKKVTGMTPSVYRSKFKKI